MPSPSRTARTTIAQRPSLSTAAILAPTESSGLARVLRPALVGAWVAVAGAALMQGLDYYRLPLAQRAFSPLYDTYKPGGEMGHLYGVAGLAMMTVGVALYSLRKRVGFLHGIGKLKHWLEVHIFLCTLGPFLVVLHTAFRFGGIVAIAFWSMAIVVASGVFGRYVYVRIPKTLNGRFLSLKTIDEQKRVLVRSFARRANMTEDAVAALLPPRVTAGSPSLLGAFVLAARFDFQRRRELKRVGAALRRRGVGTRDRDDLLSVLDQEIRLEQQTVLLTPFQRLFGYWHVLHLPLAVLMLVIVIIHVAVATLFGYGFH